MRVLCVGVAHPAERMRCSGWGGVCSCLTSMTPFVVARLLTAGLATHCGTLVLWCVLHAAGCWLLLCMSLLVSLCWATHTVLLLLSPQAVTTTIAILVPGVVSGPQLVADVVLARTQLGLVCAFHWCHLAYAVPWLGVIRCVVYGLCCHRRWSSPSLVRLAHVRSRCCWTCALLVVLMPMLMSTLMMLVVLTVSCMVLAMCRHDRVHPPWRVLSQDCQREG